MPKDLANSVLSSQIWKIFVDWLKMPSDAPDVRLRAWQMLPGALELANSAPSRSASVATRDQSVMQNFLPHVSNTALPIGSRRPFRRGGGLPLDLRCWTVSKAPTVACCKACEGRQRDGS